MGMDRVIHLLYILSFCSQAAQGSLWVKGEDTEASKVIYETTGNMNIAEKTRRVPILVADCMKIIYVWVEVDNDWTIPEVNFNEHTNIITIHYRPPERSICYYKIIIKGILDEKCMGRGKKHKKGGGKLGGDSKNLKKHNKKEDKWYHKSTRKPLY